MQSEFTGPQLECKALIEKTRICDGVIICKLCIAQVILGLFEIYDRNDTEIIGFLSPPLFAFCRNQCNVSEVSRFAFLKGLLARFDALSLKLNFALPKCRFGPLRPTKRRAPPIPTPESKTFPCWR